MCIAIGLDEARYLDAVLLIWETVIIEAGAQERQTGTGSAGGIIAGATGRDGQAELNIT